MASSIRAKRVAVFLIGGIGAGIASQGIPAISAITRYLAETFDVRVYSLTAPDAGFSPEGYTIRCPPRWLGRSETRKLRWPYLAAAFAADHLEDPYDVLFSFWAYPMGSFAVALAKLARKPSIVTILGAETASVPSIGYGQFRRPITRRAVLETCRQASVVVALSSQQRDTLRRHGLRREVEVIPFGVDRRAFAMEPKDPRSPLRILHVANLTEVKDQTTLIRGFALLRADKAAKLRIVGPDRMNGRLQRLVADLGLKDDVEFVGPVAYRDLPAHYRWADMFVLTSLSEGQNGALVEAAMSGVLQVSTPVGHIDDVGRDAAVVVNPGDPVDLAEKIRAIADDPAEWRRKVARARSWAESHDLAWTVARFRAVIERVAS